ncbi:MAG: 3-deoxy-manno-octulosonate cytidylyltransferase [Sandaracinaceae bacterium]
MTGTPDPAALASLKVVCLDVDGVLTDGLLWYGPDGETLKPFHVRDGLGIKLLMRAGVEVAVISGRTSAPLERRLDDLGVTRRYLACREKGAALTDLVAEVGCTEDQVAHVGDDFIDLPILTRVGMPIAVRDAHAAVRREARWVTERAGGRGAVREIADAIVEARGEMSDVLESYGVRRTSEFKEGFKVVIPARLASTRLPGKPLADIHGTPMVVWCLRRALSAGADEVVVAVDDERIAEAVRAEGGDAELTSSSHESGTDRIAEVAEKRGWSPDTIVVNMQGDEPLLPASLLSRLADAAHRHAEAGIATMAVPIGDREEFFRESAVKAVLDDTGMALYFSRAPVPWTRGSMTETTGPVPAGAPVLRHLGLYAYRVSTLRRLAAAPRSALEVGESLEQLRAMSLGVRIHVTVVDEAPPPGVDTPEDLERARRLLAPAS